MRKPVLLTLILLFVALAFTTCKKKSSDNENSTPTPTCSDGIQNQGETGIDCGGPCSPCPSLLCNGDGSSTYMPLGMDNHWIFEVTNGSGLHDTLTVEGFTTIFNNTYYKLRYYDSNIGAVSPWSYYLRYDIAGNVFQWTGNSDVMFLPAFPWAGQVLNPGHDFYNDTIHGRRVISTTETISTGSCTYTDVVHIQSYDLTNGIVYGDYYFKKGVGPIQMPVQRLINVALNTDGGPGFVCTGDTASDSYLPMALNNKWTYDFNYTVSTGKKDTITIDGTTVLDGNTFYKFRTYNGISQSQRYRFFRNDSATGDIFEYSSNGEQLFIPDSPFVGQVIGIATEDLFSGIIQGRRVTSITATVTTNLCTYNNCLEIETYLVPSGTIVGHHYYKKGIGLIRSNDIALKALHLE